MGDKITLADITVASALVYPMKLVMSPEYRKAFPCVTRWFTTCVNQPQFKAVIGVVELAKEEMTAEGAPAVPKKEKVSPLLPAARVSKSVGVDWMFQGGRMPTACSTGVRSGEPIETQHGVEVRRANNLEHKDNMCG